MQRFLIVNLSHLNLFFYLPGCFNGNQNSNERELDYSGLKLVDIYIVYSESSDSLGSYSVRVRLLSYLHSVCFNGFHTVENGQVHQADINQMFSFTLSILSWALTRITTSSEYLMISRYMKSNRQILFFILFVTSPLPFFIYINPTSAVFFAAKFRLPDFDRFRSMGRKNPGAQIPRSQEVLPSRDIASLGHSFEKIKKRIYLLTNRNPFVLTLPRNSSWSLD